MEVFQKKILKKYSNLTQKMGNIIKWRLCYKMKKFFVMKNINKFVDDEDSNNEEKSENNSQVTIL